MINLVSTPVWQLTRQEKICQHLLIADWQGVFKINKKIKQKLSFWLEFIPCHSTALSCYTARGVTQAFLIHRVEIQNLLEAADLAGCPVSLCVILHLYVKGECNIEVHLYKWDVCVACSDTVPMGLPATKGYVGSEAQWMGPAREPS